MRVRRWLETPLVALWAAMLAVLLALPCLWTGLQTEDWVFQDVARNAEDVRVPWSVNLHGHRKSRDADTVFGHNQLERSLGAQPWIAAPRFHVSFWRPLTSLTHLADYRWWPEAVWWMHAQNVLAYAALAALATALFRRFLGPTWWAGLAGILYAVDDAHAHAVGWIANRNALFGAAFAAATLLLHDRWRRGGSRPAAVLAPLALALGLASSEIAVGAIGYLLAHALLLDSASRARRVLAVVPCLAVTVVWAVVYRALGHGAHGSGAYLDPLANPGSFALEGPLRVLALALGQLGAPPSDSWATMAPASVWLSVGGLAVSAVVAWAAWPLLRANRGLACLAVGGVLSLLPVSAALPEDRLLLLAGLGGAAVVGCALGAALDRDALVSSGARRVGMRLLAVPLLLVHAVAAPFTFPARVLTMDRYEQRLRGMSESAYSQIGHMSQALVIVNAPDFYFGAMMVMSRIARREQLAHSTVVLVGSLGEATLTGVDPNAIEVRPHGGFMTSPFNRIYRGSSDPLAPGDVIRFPGVEARVLEVLPSGDPLAVLFRFEMALLDPRMKWMVHRDGKYLPVDPPEAGQKLVIGATP